MWYTATEYFEPRWFWNGLVILCFIGAGIGIIVKIASWLHNRRTFHAGEERDDTLRTANDKR